MAKIRPLFISEEYNASGEFVPPNPYGQEVSVGREMQGGDDQDMERDLQADIGAQPIKAFPVEEEKGSITRVLRDNNQSINTFAKAIASKLGYDKVRLAGEGTQGFAYDVGNSTIIKITSDRTEAAEALKLLGKNNEHIGNFYKVYNLNEPYDMIYVIVREMLAIDPNRVGRMYASFEDYMNEFNIGHEDIRQCIKYKNSDEYRNILNALKTLDTKPNPYKKDILQVGAVIRDLFNNDIRSVDFNQENFGFKPNGNLAFYDIGYSTSSGGENFELLQLENKLVERVLSYMPGSQAMTVKKKCQLGGNGDGTSTACNQGDISNLKLSGIKEEIDGFHMDDAHKEIVHMDMDSALSEERKKFTTLYHGTSHEGGENIKKRGVKIEKSYGGYFGWGFYTTPDLNLAKENYADFAEDNDGELGVILEFRLSPNANILDLDDPQDFETWKPYSKLIGDPNLWRTLIKNGIDGLYDTSFGGVVIYNPKVLTYVKDIEANVIPHTPLHENVQLLDKNLLKTNKISPEEKEMIMNITHGDNYTYLIGSIFAYYESHTPDPERRMNDLKGNIGKALVEFYYDAQNYDPNVFPLQNYDVYLKNIHPADVIEGFTARRYIIKMMGKIPPLYLRNLRGDIRKPREARFLKYDVENTMKEILNHLGTLQRMSPERQEMYYKKIFSSEFTTFEQVKKNLENLDILFLNHDDSVEQVLEKIKHSAHWGDAKLLYNQNDIIVADVLSSDGMKELGCGSTWCFAIESSEEHWASYAENSHVNIIYNFNLEPEDKNRMVVMLPTGEFYNMYNESLEDGYQYAGDIGVSKVLNANKPVKKPKAQQKSFAEAGLHEEFRTMNELSNEDLAYRKWKRDNVTYRGISDTAGQSGENGGMAMLGQGLYSVPASNKSMARKYGKLRILVNAKPKNPKVFNTLNEWEIWFQQNVVFPISKAKGKTYPDGRDVNSITDEMLKRGYDGVIIKGREIVNYKPDNVRYYENERQLEMYYDDFVRNNEPPSLEEEIKKMISEVMDNDFSYIPENIEINVNSLPFKTEIEQAGGKIYSVGGAVRDHILQKPSKDLDLLITGLPLDKLEAILSKYGKVDAVGKSFGIIKFNTPKTGELDIAIPRTERATGQGGYQGFEVKSDHELPIEKDLERRDFTINAIAKDAAGNLIDPYHGEEDIKNKIIRMVNPQAFKDDPLRMIRAVQFAARFGFTIEPETMKAIQENADRIAEISPERILIEFDKIVKKGNPVVGAQLLEATGLFSWIFGNNPDEGVRINYAELKKAKTMGEFIFILANGNTPYDSPSDFYKDKLKGDLDTYNEIRAYELAYKQAKPHDVQTKLNIFGMNKLSPKSLESEILPHDVKENIAEMKKMGMPFSMRELQINGNDLLALGYTGQQIGQLLKDMVVDIYGGKLRNNRDLLLRHLTPKIQEV